MGMPSSMPWATSVSGRMERPSVYRVLGDLEADGLVLSWDERPTAGSVRHVYSITPKGEQVLESWMSVVAQERECLDVVLQRYWYCNAHRLEALAGGLGELSGKVAPEPCK